MLTQKLLRKRKTLAVAASAALFASAFQTGGCTVNLDESLLQSLTSLLENAGTVRLGPGGLLLNNHGGDQDDGADEPDVGDTDDSPDDPV